MALKKKFGIAGLLLLTYITFADPSFECFIRENSFQSTHYLQIYNEASCSSPNNSIDVVSTNKTTKTVASLLMSIPGSFTTFIKRNQTSLMEVINEINSAFLKTKIKFEVLTWQRKTWISFHGNETGISHFTARISDELCRLLGFLSCKFERTGEYPSAMEQDEEGFAILPANATFSINFEKWTSTLLNTSMSTLLSPQQMFFAGLSALASQYPSYLKTYTACDQSKVAVLVSNSNQKFVLAEELSSVFGTLKLILQSPLQILNIEDSDIVVFTWDEQCEANVTLSYEKSNIFTFWKHENDFSTFVENINNYFRTMKVYIRVFRTSYLGQPKIKISYVDPSRQYTLILQPELTELLGFTRTEFHANTLYVSEKDWDAYKYNSMNANSSFVITLAAFEVYGISFSPYDVIAHNLVFTSVFDALNEAVYEIGKHKVSFRIENSQLTVSMFDHIKKLQFSPCINEILQVDDNFAFQSKTTTMQLPTVFSGDTDASKPPQGFRKKSTNPGKTPQQSRDSLNTRTQHQSHGSINPPISSITPLSAGFEEDASKCNHLLSEVLPTKRYLNRFSTTQFIETVYKCGTKAKFLNREGIVLDGFMIIIVNFGKYKEDENIIPALIFEADLAGVKQTRRIRKDGIPEWYTVVGTKDVPNVDLTLNSQQVRHIYKSVDEMSNAIPYSNAYPTAVFLLYFQHKDRHLMKKFLLTEGKVGSSWDYIGMPVTSELAAIINPRVLDYFIYGSACGELHSTVMKSVYSGFPDDCSDAMFSSQTVIPYYEQDIPVSYSRCSMGNKPFQVFSFKDAPSTPSAPNNCPAAELRHEFNLKYARLQSTAQKIVLNVWSAIRQSKSEPTILEGPPREVTARLTGVRIAQLKNAQSRWRENAIITPQKDRTPVCRRQIHVDTFDRDWIRARIIEGYKKGAAITLRQLYKDFITYKQEQYATLLKLHEDHPESHSKPETFTCCYRTFRKIIHIMGLKNGIINKRAGIVQRDDIVVWRGKYLRVLRWNDAAETPKKIVYIDETWIDENTRVARGWFPKNCKNLKDMAPFTYGTEKVGKGPRLVVLSAVTEDGIIPASILIYKVSKSKTAADYHDNVNAETFNKWYSDLLNYLDSTGDKWIIVMDNASYHSTKIVPNKSENKPVLYEWLQKQSVNPALNIQLPENIKDILKWELVEMVERVAQSESMQSEIYQIDKLTKAKGHSVLRLPPYNCDLNPIELVWKDLKHEIRKRNTNQNLDTIKNIAIQLLQNMDKSIIRNHFQHVKNLGKQYWEEDKVIDNVQFNRIIITEEDDDTEEDISDDDEDEDIMDGDEVDMGGDMTLWDCDWAYDVFERELAIGDYMVEAPAQRRNTRYRVCNVQNTA